MIRIREAGLVAAGAITLAACTSGGGVGAGATASSAPATSPSTSPATSQSPAPGASPGGRLQQVKERGSVRVCTTGDYRPFTYKDPRTGAYSGIDVTMAQDLAARLGVKVEWVPTTWKTLMPDFTARCDIGMGGISISTDRLQQAFFTEPLLTEGKTPITLCSKVADYDTVAEINKAGVRSITPIGGTNEKFAVKHYPQGRIIRWKDNNTIFDEIIAGRADVMTTDASETVWVASTHPRLCAVHPRQALRLLAEGLSPAAGRRRLGGGRGRLARDRQAGRDLHQGRPAVVQGQAPHPGALTVGRLPRAAAAPLWGDRRSRWGSAWVGHIRLAC